jgi:hypothetical protein
VSLPRDEVYFFTTRRVVHSFWNRGLEWYEKLLTDCIKPGAKSWGEITPVYLLDEDTPGLIHRCVPEAKLICLLRDQSERAYSWYRFFLKVNPDLYRTDYCFERFLTYHTDVYGREGFYLEHINRYLDFFPRESLLILLYDDLVSTPRTLVRDVYEFLEVDTDFVPPSAERRINEANPAMFRSETVRRTSRRLSLIPWLRWLSRPVDRLNSESMRPELLPARHQLDPHMRKRMRALYEDHNRQLGAFLGRDLSHWNSGTPLSAE